MQPIRYFLAVATYGILPEPWTLSRCAAFAQSADKKVRASLGWPLVSSYGTARAAYGARCFTRKKGAAHSA